MLVLSRTVFVLCLNLVFVFAQSFNQLKLDHSLGDFSNNQIRHLADLQDDAQFERDLARILIPRVVGSEGHSSVYNYIKNVLEQLEYHVEIDEFTDSTPFGNLTFKNIIATLNPNAERFFIVAAHYDSKYFQNGKFVGATDSAVPCAMMLQMARIFKRFSFPMKEKLALKFLFFDGEEAFDQWGPKDSIYGARHLAAKWHQKKSRSSTTNEFVSDLQRIDCLMLLDLLGTANPTIFNYFENTRNLFNAMSQTERKLYKLGLLKRSGSSAIFIRNTRQAFIEDDHIPFLKKNVRIMHIIPIPFPDVWHTEYDNADILDLNTIQDMSLTIQLFVARYLHTQNEEQQNGSFNGSKFLIFKCDLILCFFVLITSHWI